MRLTQNLIWIIRFDFGLRQEIFDHLEAAFIGGNVQRSHPILARLDEKMILQTVKHTYQLLEDDHIQK